MSEKRLFTEQQLKDYRELTISLTVWLAQVQRFADMIKRGETFNKRMLIYACYNVEGFKKEFIEAKQAMGFTDGFQFLEDNNFIGFSIKDGRLITSLTDVEEIFDIVDKWYYGFPNNANHYQFEVATYVVALAEAERKALTKYPEEIFGKNSGR